MAQVQWQFHLWPDRRTASSAAIAAVEAKLGVRFPADYLAVARDHQGMSPDPGTFAFGDGYSTVLNHLLHFQGDSPTGALLSAQAALEMSDAPPGLVVFAQDPGGLAICFDFRDTPDAPPVVILDHNIDPLAPLPVADSFAVFLDLLH